MNLYEKYKSMGKTIRVASSDDKTLFLVKYTNLGVDFTDELVRQARGLVIDIEGNVIARPFEKFFNLNENINKDNKVLAELSAPDEGPVQVYDKLDGSLVIAFFHNDDIQFASSGSLTSEHSILFREYYNTHLNDEQKNALVELTKTYTVLFEYTGPDNQIVIPYTDTKLTILGLINTQTGDDLFYDEIVKLTANTGIDVVSKFDFNTLDEAIEYVDNAHGVEGVIVRFVNTGKRVKIKTKEYFELHKMTSIIDRQNPRNSFMDIAEILIDGREGDLDDVLSSSAYRYAQPEFFKEVEAIRKEIITAINAYNKFCMSADIYIDLLDGNFSMHNRDENEVIDYIDDYPLTALQLVSFARELNSFRTKQKDFFKMNEAAKGSKYKAKLIDSFRDIYGTVANYPHLITAKSFAFKEYNVMKFIKGN